MWRRRPLACPPHNWSRVEVPADLFDLRPEVDEGIAGQRTVFAKGWGTWTLMVDALRGNLPCR